MEGTPCHYSTTATKYFKHKTISQVQSRKISYSLIHPDFFFILTSFSSIPLPPPPNHFVNVQLYYTSTPVKDTLIFVLVDQVSDVL